MRRVVAQQLLAPALDGGERALCPPRCRDDQRASAASHRVPDRRRASACRCTASAGAGPRGPECRAPAPIASTSRSGRPSSAMRADRARPAPRPVPATRASLALRRVLDGGGAVAPASAGASSAPGIETCHGYRVRQAARGRRPLFAMITDRFMQPYRRVCHAPRTSRARVSEHSMTTRSPPDVRVPTPSAATQGHRFRWPRATRARRRRHARRRQARRRHRRGDRSLARHRPERHGAPGRGGDHRVQPRQGHRRHGLCRPAARPRQHGRFLGRRDCAPRSTRRWRLPATPPKIRPRGWPTPTGSPRHWPDLDLYHPWDLSVEEAVDLGARSRGCGTWPSIARITQFGGRDRGTRRIRIRLREFSSALPAAIAARAITSTAR